MGYLVTLTPAAERKLAKLPAGIRANAYGVFEQLESDARPRGCLKLNAAFGPAWRIRIGDYRIIYTIDDPAASVEVIDIDIRAKVYRRR